MIKAVISFFLLYGVAFSMDVDPLSKPFPQFAATNKLRLPPLQQKAAPRAAEIVCVTVAVRPSKKVTFKTDDLLTRLREKDRTSPDVVPVYGRDRAAVGFLETGSELINSAAEFGKIKRLRLAKPGSHLQKMDKSIKGDRIVDTTSPTAFSGVIFTKAVSKIKRTEAPIDDVQRAYYKPKTLNVLRREVVFSDEEQIVVNNSMKTTEMPSFESKFDNG